MTNTKTGTPWRTIILSNYLSRDDFDRGEVKDLTIESAGRERVKDPTRGSEDDCLVIHFTEPVKPMIFNVTNSRRVQKITGTKYIERWSGQRISVFFDETVKVAGKKVGGLRVKEVPPPSPATAGTCTDCGKGIVANGSVTAEQIAEGTVKTYGVPLCWDCSMERAKERKAAMNGAK